MNIKNKINKSLPIDQRLGQVGVNTKNEEMIISKYNNSKNIMVTFLHNGINVKSTYSQFIERIVGNPLYYQEQREGQIRKSNNGQMMLLLIYNDTMNCVVEFEDGTLVDCRYECFDNGQVANPNYIKPSENKFYFDEKLNCWVGVTKKGEEFLFSHPDEKVIKYVKSCTWRTIEGYIKNSKNRRLHHIILPLTNEAKEQGYDRIDHINNNPLDNRYENLRWSNAKENAKNRKSIGKSGITGLRYDRISSKWSGYCNHNKNQYTTNRYKDKNEALIDLLILQKMFGATHNEHLFYMLDDISQERIDFVENYIKEKIEKKKKIPKITCKNTFEKIDDDTYKMYDSKGRSCLVDVEDVEKIKLGSWSCKKNKNKQYFSGILSYNTNCYKKLLHRFILNISDTTYSNYMIDHLDGDSLNNKKDNLIITDVVGNNINISGKGYTVYNNKYNVFINLWNICKSKCMSRSFSNKEDAIKFYLNCKKYLMNGRLQWETKEELDKWLEDVKYSEISIDEIIKQHYTKLYMSLKDLIEEFDRNGSSSFLMQ